MAEYISRENTLDVIREMSQRYTDESLAEFAYNIVSNIPAADVQPVKRGKWFHINNEGFIYCSECNHEAYWDTDYGQQLFDYCPYCGAKMTKQ